MFRSFRETIKRLIVRAHTGVFRHPPGEATMAFIRNLLYAFFGVGGATLITFGFNVLAIRHIGPSEYGRLNLIISISEFFMIVPLWGLTATALRYLGAEPDNRREIIGTSFTTVFFLSLLLFPAYIFSRPLVEGFLKIDSALYYFSVLYALFHLAFYLFQSFFQGLGMFKFLSVLSITSSLFFVGTVCFSIFYLKDDSFLVLYWSNLWRPLLVVLAGAVFLRRQLFCFCRQTFRRLFAYGSLSMLSVFAGFFSLGSIDNLMINYYLGSTEVGIYSAYYVVFSILTGKILNTFSQTFLPAAAHTEDVGVLYRKAIVLRRKGVFLAFLVNLALVWILFQFYGREFDFDLLMAMIISLSTSIYCFQMVFGNILASRGVQGVRYGPLFAVVNAALNVLLNFILIPSLGLRGAALSTLVTVAITMNFPVFILRKYFYGR